MTTEDETTEEDRAGIEYLPNGKIKIHDEDDDGTPICYTLRLPKFGAFKEIKSRIFECNDELQAKAKEFGVDGKVDKTDIVALSQYATDAEKLVDATFDMLADLIGFIFEKLSDTPLPDDTDDWPVWLVTDQGPMMRMLQHWKTVPLGRG